MNIQGFYKMHRHWWDHPQLRNKLDRIFAYEYFIAKARFTAGEEVFNHIPYQLNRGQFVTSIEELNKELSKFKVYTTRVLRNIINDFEKGELITTNKTNRRTIITVCNYEVYQGASLNQSQTETHKNDKHGANQSQTEVKPYKEEGKIKDKNVNNVITLPPQQISMQWNIFNNLYPSQKRDSKAFQAFKDGGFYKDDCFDLLIEAFKERIENVNDWASQGFKYCPNQLNFFKNGYAENLIEQRKKYLENPNHHEIGGF